MTICPECKEEYDNAESGCPNCTANKVKINESDMKWHVLTTVMNDIEFAMVAGLLEMGNIPVIRQVKGVDGFLQIVLGVPMAGIDILVPEDKFDEAYQLINSNVDESELLEQEEESEQLEETEEK